MSHAGFMEGGREGGREVGGGGGEVGGGGEGRVGGRKGGERVERYFFLRSKDWDVSHESWSIRMNHGALVAWG